MENSPELSERKKVILYSAIDNYIKLASPITSLLVQQTELHDLCTATLRNELNALEAMGFLKQLHTSSGRVPTTKGYRFFVNETLKDIKCNGKNLSDIKNKMFSRSSNLSEIVDCISKVVSTTTNYPTVFMFDGFENLLVQGIKTVYLLNNQILVLVETNVGAISNTIFAQGNITKQDCDNASQVFTSIFGGNSIKFLTQNIEDFSLSIKKSMKEYESIFKLVLQVLDVYYNKTKSKVSNEGIIKLLENKELKNVENARNILTILDDDEKLKNLMEIKEDNDGISVNIGDEVEMGKLCDCAIIKTPLVLDGRRIATVGVIGPERIDYANIASVLKFVSDELKDKLKKGGKYGTGKQKK